MLGGRAQGCAWPLGHTHSVKVDALDSALHHHHPALAQAELQTPQSVWDNTLNPNPCPPSKKCALIQFILFVLSVTHNQCPTAQ